jgi:hypothetical protein
VSFGSGSEGTARRLRQGVLGRPPRGPHDQGAQRGQQRQREPREAELGHRAEEPAGGRRAERLAEARCRGQPAHRRAEPSPRGSGREVGDRRQHEPGARGGEADADVHPGIAAVLRQHRQAGDRQHEPGRHHAAAGGTLEQPGEEEQRVDAEHHEAALGEHQRDLARRERRVLLALQHDAEFEAGQHEHDRAVQPPQRHRTPAIGRRGLRVVLGAAGATRGSVAASPSIISPPSAADITITRSVGSKVPPPMLASVADTCTAAALRPRSEQEAQQRHRAEPREAAGALTLRRVLGDKRGHHGHDGRHEEAGGPAQRVDAGEPDPVGPQQGQQTGDIADQTDHQDAAAAPAVGDQAPQRRADQHPGGVQAAEQADMACDLGFTIGCHQRLEPGRQQRHQRAVPGGDNEDSGGQPCELHAPQPSRFGRRRMEAGRRRHRDVLDEWFRAPAAGLRAPSSRSCCHWPRAATGG